MYENNRILAVCSSLNHLRNSVGINFFLILPWDAFFGLLPPWHLWKSLNSREFAANPCDPRFWRELINYGEFSLRSPGCVYKRKIFSKLTNDWHVYKWSAKPYIHNLQQFYWINSFPGRLVTGGVNKPGGGQITMPNNFKQLYFIRDFIIGIW